jgi:toxin YoeB
MKLSFEKEAWEDYLDWATDKQVTKKLNDLLKSMLRTPYDGVGNPEALKYHLTGLWSRRINSEHRMVYEVIENVENGMPEEVHIISVKTHYE